MMVPSATAKLSCLQLVCFQQAPPVTLKVAHWQDESIVQCAWHCCIFKPLVTVSAVSTSTQPSPEAHL